MIYRFRRQCPDRCERCAATVISEIGPLSLVGILRCTYSGWQIRRLVKLSVFGVVLYWQWQAYCADCMMQDQIATPLSETLFGKVPRGDWSGKEIRVPFG